MPRSFATTRRVISSWKFFRIALLLSTILLVVGRHDLPAQTIDWARVHTLTLKGIHQLYNMDLDKSLETFRQVSLMAPADPRGHFFEAMVAFWKFSLLGKQDEYDHFLALSDTVIDVCDAVLDRDDNNALAHFFLGGIYGYRGMASRSQGSMVRAVLDGRKGYIHLQDAVRINPTLYDAQMGLGIFEYLIAKAPHSLAWLLTTIGFPGNIDEGLAALQLAAEKGTYAATEAKFFLGLFLFNEHREADAFKYMNDLTTEYPENILFVLNEATMYRRRGNLDSALALSNRAMAINATRSVHYGEEFGYSTLASVQFALNDFANARQNYALYMEKVANKSLITNWILYRYGVCQEIMGDRAGAVKTYRMAREVQDEPSWEVRSSRLCKLRAEIPLSKGDIDVLMAGNLIDRKLYDQADSLLDLALQRTDNDDDTKAEACYERAEFQFAKGDNSAVVATCSSVMKLDIKHETWIPPQSWFLAGLAYAKMGRKAEAMDALRKVKTFDDYENQSSLEHRVDEELKKLELP